MRKLARAITLIGSVTLLLTWFGATPAYADGNSGATGVALAINSWPVVLAGFCGAAATQLTALLTHRDAPQWLKSGVNLIFTSLAGVLITVTVVAGKTWEDYLVEIAVAELVALGVHYSGATSLASAAAGDAGFGASLTPIVATQPDAAGLIKPVS